MSLKPAASKWIGRRLADLLRTEGQQLATVRESVERALQQARTEEDTLLSLRLRGSIDDETYERRRLGASSRRAQLELQLAGPLPTTDTLLERVEHILDFAQLAPSAFRSGSPVQQRQVLETVGSNFRVAARKAAYDAKKPFALLATASTHSSWYACVKDVRTFLLSTPDFFLPEIKWPSVGTHSARRNTLAA